MAFFSPRLYGTIAYLVCGIYLLIGGRWLIENVFLPAPTATPSDEPEQTGGVPPAV